jgi:hypothetical protein
MSVMYRINNNNNNKITPQRLIARRRIKDTLATITTEVFMCVCVCGINK